MNKNKNTKKQNKKEKNGNRNGNFRAAILEPCRERCRDGACSQLGAFESKAMSWAKNREQFPPVDRKEWQCFRREGSGRSRQVQF